MPGDERWDGPEGCLVTASREGARRELVDLVASGVTAVRGEPGAAEELLLQAIREAAEGRWSPACRVLVAGLDETTRPLLPERVGWCGSLGEASERLRSPSSAPTLVALGRDARGEPGAVEALMVSVRAGSRTGALLGFPWAGAEGSLEARPSEAAALPAKQFPEDPGPDAPVEVAVLGPVEVRGVSGRFDHRPKLSELVVYLVLHPEGAAARDWSEALWPNRLVPAQTLSNRLSEARRALGFAADGRPRLRKTGDRYVLEDVGSDWADFRLLSDPGAPPESWRTALRLVRGRPFSGLKDQQWCHLEGLGAEMEMAVLHCGLRLGEVLLSGGDPDGAGWAATRALRATPFDERLYRLLMRAADAAGNWAGVEATLRHLALVLEVDGDPLRAVHPETAALYRQLLGRRAPGTGVARND